MAVYERFHTIFKKLARARGEHLMANIHNNYVMMIDSDMWRLQMTAAGVDITTKPNASSLGGAMSGIVDYSELVLDLGMKEGKSLVRLPDLVYEHVQDVWAIKNKDYAALRERARTEARKRSRRGGRSLVQIPPDWTPRSGSLSQEEKLFTQMTPMVKLYKKFIINKKWNFRTRASQEKNLNDDSCIKEWYKEEDGSTAAAYGWIKMVFVHEMYPGTVTRYIIFIMVLPLCSLLWFIHRGPEDGVGARRLGRNTRRAEYNRLGVNQMEPRLQFQQGMQRRCRPGYCSVQPRIPTPGDRRFGRRGGQ